MKVGIYAASEKVRIKDTSVPFIAVDKGYDYLMELGITPIKVIGDFDSIKDPILLKNKENIVVLPVMKDETDTFVAVEKAIALGYNEIDLYGVTGGRLDHFIATLRLLVRYKDYKITIYDNQNKIYVLNPGVHLITKDGYPYISFFSCFETDISIRNVKYPLTNYHLQYDDGLCISNEIIGNDCLITITDSVYVIQSTDNI